MNRARQLIAATDFSTVAAPSIDPPATLFTGTLTVTATVDTGATAKYTTDGTEPVETSADFPGGGLSVASSTVLTVAAFRADAGSGEMRRSKSVRYTYTLDSTTTKVATPSIVLTPPSYTSFDTTSTCSIYCATSSSTIKYRINGGSWNTNSASFSVNALDSVESYATKGGSTDSEIAWDIYENIT